MTRPPFGNPNALQAALGQAMALHQQGRIAEAEPLYRSILQAKRDHFEALHFLGLLEAQRGNYAEADRLMRRSLEINTTTAEAYANHARVLNTLKRSADALAACDRALVLNPRSLEALVSRGNAFKDLERYEAALASYDRALALQPAYFPALTNRGTVLLQLKRPAEALASLDRALAARPDSVEPLNNRGNALHELGRYEEALACFEKVLALQPSYTDAIYNRGNALMNLCRNEEALAEYQRFLAVDPDHVEALTNRANVLQVLGRNDEALAAYGRALALKPGHVNALRNRALLFLSTGRFAEGWDGYESRFEEDVGVTWRGYAQKRWTGEHVPGTLLIWGEQGLGDEILHASMVPDLEERASCVVFEAEPRLVDLFARSFPWVQVVAKRPELYRGEVAAHEAMGSLGRHLRRDAQSFPRREHGFLLADSRRAAALRERLQDGRAVIGLSWKSANPRFAKAKSASLLDFATLLRSPGFRFIDLQYGETATDRDEVRRVLGVTVEHLDDIDNTNDLDGLASLMMACDAVVTVSNTTAHLAGALGRPCWVFAPYGVARIWYWFKDLRESPWYPRVRVEHQRSGQSWSELISSVVEEISSVHARPGK